MKQTMSDISIVALVLSVVALAISIYTLLLPGKQFSRHTQGETVEKVPEVAPSVPDVAEKTPPPSIKPMQSSAGMDHDLREQVQKFSMMVTKNLEQLNTRVGVKSNIKPIDLSDKSQKNNAGPDVVDSEVSSD